MAAQIPMRLLRPVYTDADWADDFLFFDQDEQTPADFTGSTFSLAMAPFSAVQAQHGFILTSGSGALELDGNRIGIRVRAATMAGREALRYRFELREHQADGDIVALAVGEWTLIKGVSLSVVEGVPGGGFAATGVGSITIIRPDFGIPIVRGSGGPAGKSAYQLAVQAGAFTGSLEDWLIATGADGSAEIARATAEELRAGQEAGRVAAEDQRVADETARLAAEEVRSENEGERIAFATALDTSAQDWALAESGRVTAEGGRVSGEAGRVTAEGGRVTAEGLRVTAEAGRAGAETSRVTAEDNRTTAEAARQSATAAAVAATVELPIRVITGTTGTIDASDAGKVIECTNAAGCVVTVSNAVPAKFVCELRAAMAGASLVSVVMQAGGTLRQSDGLSRLRRQWSSATLHCRANAGGSAAEVVLVGDLSV